MRKTLPYDIFRSIVSLFLSSKKFHKQKNNGIIEEFSDYCLIDKTWLEKFKKTYNYEEIEEYFEKCYFFEYLKQEILIKFLYDTSVGNNNKNKLSKIKINIDSQEEIELKDNFIPINTDESPNPKNFLLINEETYSSIIKSLFPNKEHKIIKEDILLGLSSLIILLKKDKKSIICIFLNLLDDIKREFKIIYTDEKTKISEIEKIKKSGLEVYFNENKLNKNEIKEQSIDNKYNVININYEILKKKSSELNFSFLLSDDSGEIVRKKSYEEKRKKIMIYIKVIFTEEKSFQF